MLVQEEDMKKKKKKHKIVITILLAMAVSAAISVSLDAAYTDIYNKGVKTLFMPGDINANGGVDNKDVAALFRYVSGGNVSVNETALDGFADKEKVSAWAVDSMKWAVTQGVISGKSGNLLDPLGNGTRAECAQMIMKLIKTNMDYGELPKVGDIVTFGRYEQDNNLENGKEPIEWQVLDIDTENRRVFVLSKFGLDQVDWNSDWNNDATWATCSLRNWMNNDFKNKAFSFAELNRIPTVTVSTEDNKYFHTSGGEDSQDQIFSISVEEMEKYLGPYNLYSEEWMWGMNQNLICAVTPYAQSKGVWHGTITEEKYWSDNTNWYNPVTRTFDLQIHDIYTEDVIGVTSCLWWLRTPGMNSRRGLFIRSNGDGGSNCRTDTYTPFTAARPAMWIQY